jgi:hypothetical protein
MTRLPSVPPSPPPGHHRRGGRRPGPGLLQLESECPLLLHYLPDGWWHQATTTASSGGGSSLASRLAAVSNSMKGAEGAPFKATYSAMANGKTETITFEQDPPKFLFGTSGGEVVDTGSTTYFCSTTGTPSCFSSSTEDPLAALLQELSPKTYVASLQAAQAALAARTAGYNATFSTQTFAGQPSTCVTITQTSGTEGLCHRHR